MKEPASYFLPEIHPEQYELAGRPAGRPVRFRRREFLKLLGTGLVVLCVTRRVDAQAESGGTGSGARGGQGPSSLQPTLRRIRGIDEGSETCPHHFGRDGAQACDGVESRRYFGAQGGRAGIRERTAPLRLRRCASRDALRKGSPPTRLWRHIGFA